MKLHLKREEEKRGLISKKTYYTIKAKIQLTDEERQIVKSNGLLDAVMVTCALEEKLGGERDYPVSWFLKGDGIYLPTQNAIEAERWENEIKDACRALKDNIEAAQKRSGGSEEVVDF